MTVLDENIPEDQVQLLRSWRLRAVQIGKDIGRSGMSDEQIIPLLRRLPSPTFFTRDADFWDRRLCHDSYCLVFLDLLPDEVASFVRRTMRHKLLNSKAKRKGRIVEVSHLGLRIAEAHRPPDFHPWTLDS